MTHNKPALTVDAVVIVHNDDGTKLLTITRKNTPFAGSHALPGGYVNDMESTYNAVIRELREETGLDLSDADPIAMHLRSNQDLRRDNRGWTITQPYLFHLTEERYIKAGDDAKTCEWTELISFNEEMAFDHGAIVCEALGMYWKAFPSYHSSLPDTNPFGTISKYKWYEKTSVYPGTFNPWHVGHSTCALHGSINFSTQCIIIPDANPIKPILNSCAWKRFQDLCTSTYLSVYPGFCGTENRNFLHTWFPYMNCHANLIIGDDSLFNLKQWKNYGTILDVGGMITVIRRCNDDVQNLELIREIEKHRRINFTYVSHNPHTHLSSTKLRADSALIGEPEREFMCSECDEVTATHTLIRDSVALPYDLCTGCYDKKCRKTNTMSYKQWLEK